MNDTALLTRRLWRVWLRNFVVYQRIWKVNFLTPLLEPLFYILAFGLGFGGLLDDLTYGGRRLGYTAFIAPALIATAVMWNAFFETTYASFVRMYYQKTFDAMLATPLSLDEVIVAEVAWSATKSAGAAAIMLTVLGVLGFINFPMGLMVIPAAFLGGIAFGGIGMLFTGLVPSIDMFNLPIFLFVTPMFLFSGTFFPVSNLPAWASVAAQIFPLYHLVELMRYLSLGVSETAWWWNIGYLVLFGTGCTIGGVWAMRRRLIV